MFEVGGNTCNNASDITVSMLFSVYYMHLPTHNCLTTFEMLNAKGFCLQENSLFKPYLVQIHERNLEKYSLDIITSSRLYNLFKRII